MKPWALLLFLSCSQPCYQNDWARNYTDVQPTGAWRRTPAGLLVDDPRQELDLERLDRATAATLACLNRIWPIMTAAERQQAYCTGVPALEIRTCLRVQVPSWHVSTCTGAEIFSCSVPATSCEAKGQTPTPACPCSCRAIIQDQSVILTAPNLELYPAQLSQLLTGCDQIWSTPLSACGSPALAQ